MELVGSENVNMSLEITIIDKGPCHLRVPFPEVEFTKAIHKRLLAAGY